MNRASQVTIGLVNRKNTTRSITVLMPSANAKPFTTPIAKMKSTTAASSDTASAATQVIFGAGPAGLDGDPQRLAVAHLVADPFEVDDERVGGDTDRHDEPGDAGQRQREPGVLAEEEDRGVGDRAAATASERDDDDAEAAVVEQASRGRPGPGRSTPAQSPACSWSAAERRALLGDRRARSNCSGSAPYFRLLASDSRGRPR